MAQEISKSLNTREARALTDRINAATGELLALVKEAYDGRAWDALGYGSWREYAMAEFSISKSHAYRLLDQAKVVAALAEAISPMGEKSKKPVVEVSERVARDIKPVLAEVTQEIREKVAAGADPITTTYSVIEAKRVKPVAEVKPAHVEPQSEPEQDEPSEIEQLREANAELADLVESYSVMEQGEHAMVKEMATLRGKLRVVESQRDQWMRTCNELKREVKALRRKAA